MADVYHKWLKQHLKDATAEYKRTQVKADRKQDDGDLYDRVHQMWGYLSGLEKCLKELVLSAKPVARKAAKKKR